MIRRTLICFHLPISLLAARKCDSFSLSLSALPSNGLKIIRYRYLSCERRGINLCTPRYGQSQRQVSYVSLPAD
jgi:hypothetical protein